MKIKTQNAVAAAILATATAFSFAACSQQSADDENGGGSNVVSYEEINQEYQASVAQLDWPDSYTPPASLDGEDPADRFQKGYGDSRASLFFECAWEKEWLASYAADANKADTALSQLEKVPDMGYMSPERADDATRQMFNDYLNQAKLGDPSGFQENIDNNCPAN